MDESDDRIAKGRVSPLPHDRPTEDERLLQGLGGLEKGSMDSWRVFRIMGEFVEGFEEMAQIGTAVSFFGSARTKDDDPMYEACVEASRQLGNAGFSKSQGAAPG